MIALCSCHSIEQSSYLSVAILVLKEVISARCSKSIIRAAEMSWRNQTDGKPCYFSRLCGMQTVNEWVYTGYWGTAGVGWNMGDLELQGESKWVRAVTLRSSTRRHATVPPLAELLVCAEISLGPARLGRMRWSRSTWRQLSPTTNPYQSPSYFLLCLVHTSLPALSVFPQGTWLFPFPYRHFRCLILHIEPVKEQSYLLATSKTGAGLLLCCLANKSWNDPWGNVSAATGIMRIHLSSHDSLPFESIIKSLLF